MGPGGVRRGFPQNLKTWSKTWLLETEVLQALLEEFATRDGTDYGISETVLEERVAQLRRKLKNHDMTLLFDSDSESWDLLSRERASEFLTE